MLKNLAIVMLALLLTVGVFATADTVSARPQTAQMSGDCPALSGDCTPQQASHCPAMGECSGMQAMKASKAKSDGCCGSSCSSDKGSI